jgi:tetratricopeptide (TPR) repeat protein
VSRIGDKDVPKVIDFGIAKAIEEPFSPNAPRTLAGQIMGTPECMSPEQIRGGEDVDTRSDVYSLGVMLYELLVGAPPFDRDRLARADLPQILRILGEEEPLRPSVRWRGLPEDVRRRAADARRTEPGTVERELRDDLDWIALRALEKEPERRYSSVSELAADVRRHLEHRPVEAGPPSPTQRLRKFVRRNRAAVVGASLGTLALVAGIVGTTGQAVRATRERARAERHLEETSRFTNRLVVGVNERIRNLPGSVGAREYLVRATIDHLDEMARDPEAEEALRRPLAAGYDQLARVQLDLGRTEEALASGRRAVELEREAAARFPDDPGPKLELAARHRVLASVLYSMGRTGGSLEEHERSEALLAEVAAASDDPDPNVIRRLAETRSRAGYLLIRLGRVDEAIERHESAIAALRAAVEARPDDSRAREDLARATAFLGEGLGELGRDREALEMYRSAAAVFEEESGPALTARTASNTYPVLLAAIGQQESQLGRHEEAIEVLARSFELRRDRAEQRPDHAPVRHDLARGHWQLADVLVPAGRPAEAADHYREAHAILRGLADADPGNRRARKDLVSVDLELAALALADSRIGAARERLDGAAARNDSLRAGEPERSDHSWSAARIETLRAEVHEAEGRWEAARERWAAAAAIAEEMRAGGLLTPLIEEDLGGIPAGIARCDSALAGPTSRPPR